MIEAIAATDGARRPTPSLEWLRSPARPALQVASALDRVRRAPTILDAQRTLGDVLPVVDEVVRDGADPDSLLQPILEAIDDPTDTITATVAAHALARVPGPRAELELAGQILDGPAAYQQHALWAMSDRAPSPGLALLLARAVADGGLAGMHAQRALAVWADREWRLVLEALVSRMAQIEASDARRYLAETVGLIPGPAATAVLERIAVDPAEAIDTRVTAVAAFSERVREPMPPAVRDLADAPDELGEATRSARAHRALLRRGPRRTEADRVGVRVAQVHLGEAGGLATLIPQLGDALAGLQRVAESITITRVQSPARPGQRRPDGHRLEPVELPAGEGATFVGRWPAVVAIERSIRAAFLAGPLPDVVHLRMADPGAYAGATAARSLGIPTVFTFAPDPHGPIAAAEASGALDRSSFASVDAREALWFRSSVVERLARDAQEVVLFPRAGLRERIATLTGVDLAVGRPRHTVVAEGIDTARIDDAATTVADAHASPTVLEDLHSAIGRMPSERHGLPLIVSVGRMHEHKGMARLVEAFALHRELAERANLVIVGGALDEPSAQEAAELARVRRLFDEYPGLRERVVLLGRRPHEDVALVLAAARSGWRSSVGPAGSYVCASAKEEFGLAILEAMAAGLPVTAPVQGGPATYVDHGRTGTLVDTTDHFELAAGVQAALDLSVDQSVPGRTRALVDERYTLQRMARTLTAVYRVTTGASTLGAEVAGDLEDAA